MQRNRAGRDSLDFETKTYAERVHIWHKAIPHNTFSTKKIIPTTLVRRAEVTAPRQAPRRPTFTYISLSRHFTREVSIYNALPNNPLLLGCRFEEHEYGVLGSLLSDLLIPAKLLRKKKIDMMTLLLNTLFWKQQNNEPPSRLLSLPGEIRDKIYGYVFEDIEDQVVIRLTKSKTSQMRGIKNRLTKRKVARHLSLLLTCRQTYNETFVKYVKGRFAAEYWEPKPIRAEQTLLRFEYTLSRWTERVTGAHYKQLNARLESYGTRLEQVKRLDLTGIHPLIILFRYADERPFDESHLNHNDLLVRREAQRHRAILKTHANLPNVERLVFKVEKQHERFFLKLLKQGNLGRRLTFAFPKWTRVTVVIVYKDGRKIEKAELVRRKEVFNGRLRDFVEVKVLKKG